MTLAAGLVPDHSATIALTVVGAHPQLVRLFKALERDFAYFVAELRQAVNAAVGDKLDHYAPTPRLPRSAWPAPTCAPACGWCGRRGCAPPAGRTAPSSLCVDLDSDPRAGQALANEARAELAAHLSDPESRAVSGLGWALPAAGRPGHRGRQRQRLRPSSGTSLVERVLDLFYMPHAFALPRTPGSSRWATARPRWISPAFCSP